eukprot:gene3649-7277_t
MSLKGEEEEPQMTVKRRRIRNPDEESRYKGVIIWDIDDTLIIALNSAMIRLTQDVNKSIDRRLVSNVEEYLLDFLDNDLHFSEVDHLKPVEHIREWENFEELGTNTSSSTVESKTSSQCSSGDTITSKKFTPRTYARFLREKYQLSRNCSSDSTVASSDADAPEDLWIDVEKYRRWKKVLADLEKLSGSWTAQARIVLRHLSSHGCRNIVVTASEIIPAYAKLIMWELSEFFDYEDVYSSVHRSKSSIFLKILEDLGRSGCFPDSMASCGDGPDEEAAAKTFSIPFQRIKNTLDLFLVPGLLSTDIALEIPEEYR